MRDRSYDSVPFRLSEIEHRYGPSVHMMCGAMDLRPTSYDGKSIETFLRHGV